MSPVEDIPLRDRGEMEVFDVKLVAFGTRNASDEITRASKRPVRVVFCSLHADRILVTSFEGTEIN
jgi:hypothetical protein